MLKDCSGRIHQLFYDSSDFYQLKRVGSTHWSLPVAHPFFVAELFIFCGSIVAPPVCYAAIYRFLAPTGAQGEGISCVRPYGILFKIAVKMSSSSIIKSPGVKQASRQVGKQAGR